MEDSTWKEMERAVKKDGFREGAVKGSETAIQAGFDDGYILGMQYGKLLGQKHGAEAFERNEADQQPDTDRGNCYICAETPKSDGKTPVPEHIYAQTYDELKDLQRLRNENLSRRSGGLGQ